MVRTSGFHPGNRGSIPRGVTKKTFAQNKNTYPVTFSLPVTQGYVFLFFKSPTNGNMKILHHTRLTKNNQVHYSHMMFYLPFVFLFGGALGWIIDTLDRSIDRRHFTEGSAFHIPFLPIYGFGGVLLVLANPILPQNIFLSFLYIGILMGALEYLGGLYCEYVLKRRLWNYKSKYNIQGHTDLYHAFAWGALGLLFLQIEPSLLMLFQKILI
jgi:hypothetical protein